MSSATATPTGRIRDQAKARADQRVLRILEECGFSDADIDAIVEHWLAKPNRVELFTQFLVDADVLQSAAPQVLAMNWGDGLLMSGTHDLFQPDGVDKLRKILLSGRSPDTIGKSPRPQTPAAPIMSPAASPKVQTPVARKPFLVPPGGTNTPRPASVNTATPAPSSNVGSATADLPSGHLLGRCLITGRLAQGSYGVVYRALHRTLNIPVAVKVLHPDLIDHESRAAGQFRTEAMLLARLNHPNIVRVWDFDDTVDPPYIVLEFVEGANVADMIARRGSVRADLAVRIVLQVVDGLEAAYQHGIVHRDIKPANILLTREENAKIADLGLAVVADRSRELGHLPPTSPLGMAGTVAYLAPEQAGGPGTVDHRSDIYSLGATFYHMVTGQLPFTGRSPLEVLMKHAKQPLVPPCEIVPGFDRGVSDVITKMMAKNSAERHRNYDELRDALIDADITMHSNSSGLSSDFFSPAGPLMPPAPPDAPEPPARKGIFGWFHRS